MIRFRITFILFCVASLSWAALVKADPGDRPNIVLILADDLGYSDIEPYGSEIRTPNLTQLAREGLRFSNYHSASTCAPTRAMLLTGVDSHRAGVANIPEALPPSLRDSPGYRGVLGDNVRTLAELLRDAGYRTSMSGKWHLGKAPQQLPSARGFERTLALAESGADNWQQRSYLPMYRQASWFENGEAATLPEDFYSSRYLVDKAIEFIDGQRGDGRPFFSYLAFQAVHIPVQAPREFTEKYLGVYDAGWNALRQQRLRTAQAIGVVPKGVQTASMPSTNDWDALADEERRYNAKRMAVYAGMVEAMDHHIGRLMQYLKRIGEYDNTVFVFLSDNGPEPSDPLAQIGWPLRFWMTATGYSTDYDTLGERGSFNYIGPSFASAAASPLAYYKFYAGEGGLRVPLIIAGPGVEQPGRLARGLVWVTDLAPTILALAGVGLPVDGSHEPMIGKNLLPVLKAEGDRVRTPDEIIGYELGGNAALFKGDYKIVMNRPPIGEGRWQLFNIVQDPGETLDLSERMPALLQEMRAHYATYAAANGVLPMPDDYDQHRQIAINGLRERTPEIAAASMLLLAMFHLAWRMYARRSTGGKSRE